MVHIVQYCTTCNTVRYLSCNKGRLKKCHFLVEKRIFLQKSYCIREVYKLNYYIHEKVYKKTWNKMQYS